MTPVENATRKTARPGPKKVLMASARNAPAPVGLLPGMADGSSQPDDMPQAESPFSPTPLRRMTPTHATTASAAKHANAARQPTSSVMMPPRPAERPCPVNVIPMRSPTAPARLPAETTSPTSAWETLMMPAAKQPVRMRAPTRAGSVGAMAHTSVPAARPATMIRSRRTRPTRSPMAPHTGWSAP